MASNDQETRVKQLCRVRFVLGNSGQDVTGWQVTLKKRGLTNVLKDIVSIFCQNISGWQSNLKKPGWANVLTDVLSKFWLDPIGRSWAPSFRSTTTRRWRGRRRRRSRYALHLPVHSFPFHLNVCRRGWGSCGSVHGLLKLSPNGIYWYGLSFRTYTTTQCRALGIEASRPIAIRNLKSDNPNPHFFNSVHFGSSHHLDQSQHGVYRIPSLLH